MWVRFGYNPLQDPNARFLQILNIRISQDTLQSYLNKMWPTVQNYGRYVNVDFPSCEVSDNSMLVSEMRSKKTGLTISLFNVEVTQQFNISFVEFRDQRIVEFLGSIYRMERVGKFGWYSLENMNRIRQFIVSLLEAQMEEFVNNPNPERYKYDEDGLTPIENQAKWYQKYSALPDNVENFQPIDNRVVNSRLKTKPQSKSKPKSAKATRNDTNTLSGLDNIEGFDIFDDTSFDGQDGESDNSLLSFEDEKYSDIDREADSDDDSAGIYQNNDKEAVHKYEKRNRKAYSDNDSDTSSEMDKRRDQNDEYKQSPQHSRWYQRNVLGIGGDMNSDTVQVDINLDDL